MKRLFLDTNILLDAALQRDRSAYARQLLQWCDDGLIWLCASSLTYANIAYILRNHPKEEMYQCLRMLREGIEVISLDSNCLDAALAQIVGDFEDMLQYQCALAADCDAVITNNIKDFREFAQIPVYGSAEIVNILKPKMRGKQGNAE